jgi:hypothetical protein
LTKVLVADRKYDCDHMLGQFPTEADYDFLIEEDIDVYMPEVPGRMEPTLTEKRIILKFRKNYFSKEQQDTAYAGLRNAAVDSQNRGLAAGPRLGNLGNREWVTDYEYEIIDQFLKPGSNLYGEDPIEVIRNKHRGQKSSASNRARVWSIDRVKKEKFKFDDWVDQIKTLSEDEAKEKAEYVAEKLICATTYANSVHSGIAGWFDRYPRIPYGRATSYTRDHFDKFKMSYPFLQQLSQGYKDLLPWRYNNQMNAASKLDEKFLVPKTPFTTITVNRTFRTACHYDAGDLNSGLSNLLTLSNNGNYSGCYLVAPEYRIAINVRPGDLLLINNHDVMHGNTEIVCQDDVVERISLVCYFREKMLELGSKAYEDCRYQFVEDRRGNKEHPEWRPLWNGVSASMWDTQEWYDYLKRKPEGNDWLEIHHKDLKDKFETVGLEELFG